MPIFVFRFLPAYPEDGLYQFFQDRQFQPNKIYHQKEKSRRKAAQGRYSAGFCKKKVSDNNIVNTLAAHGSKIRI